MLHEVNFQEIIIRSIFSSKISEFHIFQYFDTKEYGISFKISLEIFETFLKRLHVHMNTLLL